MIAAHNGNNPNRSYTRVEKLEDENTVNSLLFKTNLKIIRRLKMRD
jgi:hypothetical protein